MLETQLVDLETQLVDLEIASPTNNIKPSLKPPIVPSSRIYKGRKKKIIIIDFIINKM